MNWLDIVIIVVLALSVLSGLVRGFIRTVLGLAGLILGIYLAGRYYVAFGNWLPIANTSTADKLLGAVCGLILGCLMCGAVLALLSHVLNIEGAISGSWLAGFLLDRFPIVLGLLPGEFDGVRQLFQ